MKKKALLLAALLTLSFPLRAQDVPVAQGAPAQGQRGVLWQAWIDAHPDALWTDDAPDATKRAVADYNRKGAYGQSIRGLRLAGDTAAQIDAELQAKGFARHDDVIRDSKTHDPIKDKDGNPIPMIVCTRDDGGALVRLKPAGDRAIPKWPKDLKNPYKGTALEGSFTDGWGDAAHADVQRDGTKRPILK